MMWQKLVGIVAFVLVSNAWAGTDDVVVENAWLRESVPGQHTVSLQLNLTSIKPARLVAVSSPLAAAVKMQVLYPAGRGKMQAREVGSLSLPRHRTVVFGENDVALMMVGLKQELNEGDHVPVTLTVELAGKHIRKLETVAEVRRLELSYKQHSGRSVQDHR
ncbi:MAG: copper chaperone PCu(A)C [Betaproteobacteria bacterium]|nr:copper chaperone PCu(A)C [Betaproteobacteria bacterium]